jgi:hypothetical protein
VDLEDMGNVLALKATTDAADAVVESKRELKRVAKKKKAAEAKRAVRI